MKMAQNYALLESMPDETALRHMKVQEAQAGLEKGQREATAFKAEFADKYGVSPAAYDSMFSGTGTPNPQDAQKYHDFIQQKVTSIAKQLPPVDPNDTSAVDYVGNAQKVLDDKTSTPSQIQKAWTDVSRQAGLHAQETQTTVEQGRAASLARPTKDQTDSEIATINGLRDLDPSVKAGFITMLKNAPTLEAQQGIAARALQQSDVALRSGASRDASAASRLTSQISSIQGAIDRNTSIVNNPMTNKADKATAQANNEKLQARLNVLLAVAPSSTPAASAARPKNVSAQAVLMAAPGGQPHWIEPANVPAARAAGAVEVK